MKNSPPRTASPILRDIFNIVSERKMRLIDLGAMVDKHENRISEYRRGKVEPGVMTVEAMAQVLGYRLVLERIAP